MDSLPFDALVAGALLILRYQFGIQLFDWYIPAWLVRWLESGERHARTHMEEQ